MNPHQCKLINVQSRLLYLTTGGERQDGRLCSFGEQNLASLKVKIVKKNPMRNDSAYT